MFKFPYGNSDFYKIITENYCYLDRTARIPLLEAMGDSLLFLRPRRFGKTLLLTMLENYYDIAKAAEFAQLFGALAATLRRCTINIWSCAGIFRLSPPSRLMKPRNAS